MQPSSERQPLLYHQPPSHPRGQALQATLRLLGPSPNPSTPSPLVRASGPWWSHPTVLGQQGACKSEGVCERHTHRQPSAPGGWSSGEGKFPSLYLFSTSPTLKAKLVLMFTLAGTPHLSGPASRKHDVPFLGSASIEVAFCNQF